MRDTEETPGDAPIFEESSLTADALIHDRRTFGPRRRRDQPADPNAPPRVPVERRARKERRRRIDPTTFEKQYTDDELEFMNAMQRFKERTGKSFPSHGDVLLVAQALGYRRTAPPQPSAEPIDIALSDGGDLDPLE